MKKVLIITFYHNKAEASASNRLRGLATHLKKFNWEPIILTAAFKTDESFPYKVHQTQYFNQLDVWKKRLHFQTNQTKKEQINKQKFKNKKTILNRLFPIFIDCITYPDYIKKGWYPSAMIKAEEIISSTKINAIISSYPPPTCHLIAKDISKKYNIPWIADYRDLWTNCHYYSFGEIRRLIDSRLERKTISNANALITISGPVADKLQELHKNKKIFVIENGFDPKLINNEKFLSNCFNITHTGSLLNGKRIPENLFIALKELFDEKILNMHDVSVDFYGDLEGTLLDDINIHNLKGNVHLHGLISKEQSIQKQRKAQMLLLLTMNNPLDEGVYTGKLFDYLAAQRPILSIGHKKSIIKELLQKTKTGVHVSEVTEIKKEIKNAYSNYLSNGCVPYNGIDIEVEKYSHKEMAKKFSNVLNDVI